MRTYLRLDTRRITAGIAAAAVILLMFSTGNAAAQSPPDPRLSALDARLTALESRVGAQDSKLDAILSEIRTLNERSGKLSAAAPAASGVSAALRAPIGHTHTCANGHTWDHTATAGHTCPVCGVSQYVQDVYAKAVNVGTGPRAVAPAGYAAPVPESVQYSYGIGSAGGGCANGSCASSGSYQTRRVLFGGGGLFGLRR